MLWIVHARFVIVLLLPTEHQMPQYIHPGPFVPHSFSSHHCHHQSISRYSSASFLTPVKTIDPTKLPSHQKLHRWEYRHLRTQFHKKVWHRVGIIVQQFYVPRHRTLWVHMHDRPNKIGQIVVFGRREFWAGFYLVMLSNTGGWNHNVHHLLLYSQTLQEDAAVVVVVSSRGCYPLDSYHHRPNLTISMDPNHQTSCILLRYFL
mmetsp:Transcript_27007/g.33142  ORF Transcript_27007/g.33142 Transcript_27007/m.33142 type:complete len:204 (-) Transcript_27007:292-903(-)